MIASSALKSVTWWAALFLTNELAHAQTATNKTSPTQHPNAAEIIRKLIADENKIEEVQSIYLRFEGKWTNTPEVIAIRKARLERQFPGLEVTAEKFSGLRSETTEELEIAWDEHRMRRLMAWPEDLHDLIVWNGNGSIRHELYLSPIQESFALHNSPDRYSSILFNSLSWLRLAPHSFWFSGPSPSKVSLTHGWGLAEDYEHAGEQELRGRRCFVLKNPMSRRRIFVGMDDHRLYGLDNMFLPTAAVRSEAGLKRISNAAHREFASEADFDAWSSSASETEKEEYTRQFHNEFFEFNQTLALHYLDDYREISPGLWFPTKQGYTTYEDSGGKRIVGSYRDLRLVESKVNQPLDAGLFSIELKDGVQVHDWGHDPPLHYKYKADRTPEEWQAIIDEAKHDDERMNRAKAARNTLIGISAPNFAETHWVNSEALTWDKLRGKVVILDFWAIWCGPCRADIPGLKSLHRASQESDIVVIGVHNPGSELADIEKHLKEFEMKHPIVIDTPAPKGSNSGGMLSSWFGVDRLPYAVVVDQQGTVAGHGTLAEMSVLARELTQKKQ